MIKTRIYLGLCFIMERIFYRNVFFIYKPIYFLYKYISDRKKIELLRKIMRPGMVVLDIGANIGFYSVLFAKLVGERGKVIAFEPENNIYSHLKKSVSDFPQVEIYNLAVGEKSEMIPFYHSDLYNVDGRTYDAGGNRKKTIVKCTSIDEHLTAEQRIDLIKIDIQGYEYYAFKGMARTIRKARQIAILAEFWPHAMKQAGVEPQVFLGLLDDLGLRVTFDSGLTRNEVLAKVNDRYFYTDFFAFK